MFSPNSPVASPYDAAGATIDEIQQDLELMALADEAKTRYSMTESHQAYLKTRHRVWHHYYAPRLGDQWPEDLNQRPGMIHTTVNIIQPVVDTEARLESLVPRMTAMAIRSDEESRQRTEAGEKLLKLYLELSGFETWLFTLNQTRAIYARGFMKPYWNKEENRPDVEIVEQPGNLRVGWGTSDFTVIDWTIYEFAISAIEAQRRFPGLQVIPAQRTGEPSVIIFNGTHSDPLETSPVGSAEGGTDILLRPTGYQPSDYERSQLRVWDYWYKDRDNKVYNAILLEGLIVDGPHYHPEYPEVPYIPVEFDHEPGSPDGLGMIQNLIDMQIEINRAVSHYSQLIQDEVDPAYQLNADSVPPGSFPKGGEVVATGGENQEFKAIQKSVNQVAIGELISMLFTNIHFTTGMADIMFGISPGTRMPGRSMELQIESANNRVAPRRQRLYLAIYRLMLFWIQMVERIDPTVEITLAAADGTLQTQKVSLKPLVQDIKRWRFVAPPITPQDTQQLTTTLVNQLTARLVSVQYAMEQLGIENPTEMMEQVEAEHMNPRMYPGDTGSSLQVYQQLAQLLPQLQQLGINIPGVANLMPGQQPQPGAPGNANERAAQEAQARQPQLTQYQNQHAPQPMTQPGSPPPVAGPVVGDARREVQTAATLLRPSNIPENAGY